MSELDLIIRRGRIVTAGEVLDADLGIAGGRVAQIGGEMSAAREIDAEGKLLFPGGVDAHVHLSNPSNNPAISRQEDFASGSAAAAAGGITTVGNMTWVGPGETMRGAMEREAAIVERDSIVDVFFHPVFRDVTDEILDEIPELLDAGCNSIKFFTLFADFDPQAGRFLEATQLAGDSGLITLIHCEDYGIIQDALAQLFKAGKSAVRYYGDAHPIVSEVVATQRAIAFAEITGAPVYVVHLAARRALELCAEARARGVPVFVEVRPIYLHLTRERFEETDGAKYVGNPPLRTQDDVDALWIGIEQGSVHTVCTDHAPYPLAQKLDPTLTVATARPGVENLQTMLPMLYSEGVVTGRISLSRFVEVLSTNAAKLFGIYPRKGTIAVGSDADIVVFDPQATWTITNEMLKSSVDYSPFAGWDVTGRVDATIRRGEVIYQDGEIVVQGGGQPLRRDHTRDLQGENVPVVRTSANVRYARLEWEGCTCRTGLRSTERSRGRIRRWSSA
jgi:dihydropyrimidinase